MEEVCASKWKEPGIYVALSVSVQSRTTDVITTLTRYSLLVVISEIGFAMLTSARKLHNRSFLFLANFVTRSITSRELISCDKLTGIVFNIDLCQETLISTNGRRKSFVVIVIQGYVNFSHKTDFRHSHVLHNKYSVHQIEPFSIPKHKPYSIVINSSES